MNPSITILGGHVIVPSEVIILNSIVLPHKEPQLYHFFLILLKLLKCPALPVDLSKIKQRLAENDLVRQKQTYTHVTYI